MNSAKIFLNQRGYYQYKDGSNIQMIILGHFFTSDVGCDTTFKDWAETATDGDSCSGNITRLEVEGDDILLSDFYPEPEFEHIVLRINKQKFIKLCNEWFEKVCNGKTGEQKPKELEIIHDNDEFWIEVKK